MSHQSNSSICQQKDHYFLSQNPLKIVFMMRNLEEYFFVVLNVRFYTQYSLVSKHLNTNLYRYNSQSLQNLLDNTQEASIQIARTRKKVIQGYAYLIVSTSRNLTSSLQLIESCIPESVLQPSAHEMSRVLDLLH